MSLELWQRFANLFDGFDRAYGQYEILRKSEKGKMDGRARTVAGQVGELQWQAHLTGAGIGLGIIPLRADDTLKFAAIDIDIYNIDLVGLEKAIKHHQFPLVPCRSKSGGVHCYAFFKEPVPAATVRERMASWAAALGFGGVEVFPKQSYRASAEDIGNWINLPYYNVDTTDRPAIVNGKPISFVEFLDHAEAHLIAPEGFADIKGPAETLGDDAGWLEGAPPCLCHFAATGGIGPGMRNEGMFNFAAYLAKRFKEDWKNKLTSYNDRYCTPPLPFEEINTIIKSMGKKGYDMKCNGPHCDRKRCRAAKFGVGMGQGSSKRPELSNITKYDGDPVLWAVEIDGMRVMCSTDDLLNQSHFNKLCMEKIHRVPGSMPKGRWEEMIDELMANIDIVPVPEDASRVGQFMLLLETFCTQTNRQGRSMDEVKQGKPYRHESKIYFISRPLIEFLDDKRFKYESEHQVWQWLREKFGAEKTVKRLKSGTANVWSIVDPWDREAPKELPANFNHEEF